MKEIVLKKWLLIGSKVHPAGAKVSVSEDRARQFVAEGSAEYAPPPKPEEKKPPTKAVVSISPDVKVTLNGKKVAVTDLTEKDAAPLVIASGVLDKAKKEADAS